MTSSYENVQGIATITKKTTPSGEFLGYEFLAGKNPNLKYKSSGGDFLECFTREYFKIKSSA